MSIFFDSNDRKRVVSRVSKGWPEKLKYKDLLDMVGSEGGDSSYAIVGCGFKIGVIVINFLLKEMDVLEGGGGVVFPEDGGFKVYETNSDSFFNVHLEKNSEFVLIDVNDSGEASYESRVGSAVVQIILMKM